MAKKLQTRIKNRFDYLTEWEKAGVELLQGEIALVKVDTQQIDENTGKVVNVPAFLMKVGANYTEAEATEAGNSGLKDTPKPFKALPWLSAKAADVYPWAKGEFAKDISVEVLVGEKNTSTTETLGTWLKYIYDNGTTNAENIAANTRNIATLNDKDSVTGSVANKIKVALEALDHTGTAGANQIVKTVTQADGKVTVTYGAITEAELPNISTSKIIVTGNTNLTTKLAEIDEAIAGLDQKQVGHTDAEINTLIDNKIDALDVAEPSADGESTSFIATAKQENGKIIVTKKKLPEASANNAGIVKLGVEEGAATYETVDTLAGQVATNTEDIADLKTAIAGGVHFRGTVNADPTTTTSLTINGKAYTPDLGDVVIYSGKEYIYTGNAWEELGDVSRIGAIETAIAGLDHTTKNSVATTHKFVSEVTQENGKIAVTYTQPTAVDVSYGATTVNAELGRQSELIAANNEVIAKLNDKESVSGSVAYQIKTAIDALDAEIIGSGAAFVTDVTQTDGKVTVTKGDLPVASTNGTAGIVALSSSTTSTSETEAATSKAVTAAYNKGAEAQERIADVESDYVRIGNDNKMYEGTNGKEMIIFDCGGAL